MPELYLRVDGSVLVIPWYGTFHQQISIPTAARLKDEGKRGVDKTEEKESKTNRKDDKIRQER